MNLKLTIAEIYGSPDLISGTKQLLEQYGNYMYHDLGLTAGKDTFYSDLKHFPGSVYTPPDGTFAVALARHDLLGCAGIKKLGDGYCEMKRLFVKRSSRNMGVGGKLCSYLLDWSRNQGYCKVLLDTNKEMADAVLLYVKMGFRHIQPYCLNENPNPVYMEYTL